VRKAPRPRERTRSAPARTEYSAIEGDMFFPKLRRQAKWVFVLLAACFAIGFVVFGVGSGGGLGLNDILQGSGGGSSGPSVSDAQKKIGKGDLAAYKELADAYRQDGNLDQAIAAGEQYLRVRPKDYEYMRTVAGDYEGQASQQRDQAAAIQDQVTSSTGGSTFAPPASSRLGRALQPGKIDSELTTAANTKLTDLYSGLQRSYSRATQLYQKLGANAPNDVLLQLLLANAAYQSQNNPVALKAYHRIIKLSPGSAEAQQARQQIQFIKAQLKVQPSR
jgi:tetratricopeptide (TPR) repeat protein